MRILYSCVIENRIITSEAGRNDLGKIAKAIVDRFEPHARKSYEHNEYVPFFYHSLQIESSYYIP